MPNESAVLRVVKELDQSMEQETMFYGRYLLDNGKVIVCGPCFHDIIDVWRDCRFEGEDTEPFCVWVKYRYEWENWPDEKVDAAIEETDEDATWSMYDVMAFCLMDRETQKGWEKSAI